MTDSQELIHRWFSDLVTQHTKRRVKFAREAWGQIDKPAGPKYLYAAVNIRIGPAARLQVDFALDSIKMKYLQRHNWDDQIIFGVLDVMFTSITPYLAFKLEILDVNYDEVNTSSAAFRIAAREATARILGIRFRAESN